MRWLTRTRGPYWGRVMSALLNASKAPFIRVSVALFALALVYALTVAARNGLADLYARPAKNFLQDTRDHAITLTEAEFQAIRSNLTESLRFAPNNPKTLTELGRLHRIQLEADSLDPAEIERHGDLAIDYYEQAAMLRPAWPWGWSSMALVRYELHQDSSAAYHQALSHATHFGPWEGQIQRLVVDLGLDTWASLSPGAKQAVLGTVDRALKRQPAGLHAIVDSEQAWQTLCGAATHDAALRPDGGKVDELARLRRYCEELGLD